MTIFLKPGYDVPVPLEAAYQTAWSVFPAPIKPLLEMPAAESSDR